MSGRILTPDVEESLWRLLDYLWLDEEKDWHASDRPGSHIFRDIERVSVWLSEEAEEA